MMSVRETNFTGNLLNANNRSSCGLLLGRDEKNVKSQSFDFKKGHFLVNDLSLVSIDDMVTEIEGRCTELIFAYAPNDFQKEKELKFYYGKGSWHRSCALSNILNNDVLNNWNGEIRTLQRINESV